MMYDELIGNLRAKATHFHFNDETSLLLLKAADAIEDLITVLTASNEVIAKNKPKWIPVTERLPEIECSYLIVDEHGEVHEAEYFDGEWVDPIEEYCVWHSKYWMSLPEPPKEET